MREEGGWLERLFRRAKLWLFSQGHDFGFFTIVFLAAIPNPLFDLAGLTCGHFLVPLWKFFLATLVGKSFFKAPLQALMVAVVFSAHSIEMLEDALDTLSKEQLPLLATSALPWMMHTLDAFRLRMAEGRPAASRKVPGFSVSMLWTSFVVLMFLAFLFSIVTSTARAYLLHQQQQDLLRLQKELKVRQAAHQSQHEQGKRSCQEGNGFCLGPEEEAAEMDGDAAVETSTVRGR